MNRFFFRLDRLLRLRRQEMQQVEVDLQLWRGRMNRLEQEAAKLRSQLRQMVDEYSRRLANTNDPGQLARCHTQVSGFHTRIKENRQQHQQALKEFRRVLGDYRQRKSFVEALESLRAKQEQDHRKKFMMYQRNVLMDRIIANWNARSEDVGATDGDA